MYNEGKMKRQTNEKTFGISVETTTNLEIRKNDISKIVDGMQIQTYKFSHQSELSKSMNSLRYIHVSKRDSMHSLQTITNK